MSLSLSLSVCDYDRTRAIFDGRANIEGCSITAVPLEPEESFHRAFKFAEFDISEISAQTMVLHPGPMSGRWALVHRVAASSMRTRTRSIETADDR